MELETTGSFLTNREARYTGAQRAVKRSADGNRTDCTVILLPEEPDLPAGLAVEWVKYGNTEIILIVVSDMNTRG